ncbi:MAG: hypothetical protein WC205_12465 [Opitutaceae bacterium]|jgi:hypothetical protein
MIARQTFFIWAPSNSVWSPWAKPVLFAELPEVPIGISGGVPPLTAPEVPWLSVFGHHTALVLDLPGEAAVLRGLQLAHHGYRPVPLFNTSHSQGEVVPTRELIAGLHSGRQVLASLSLPANAPPAFLLDSGRLPHRIPVAPGKYDNRWVVLPQDFPSGNRLRELGIDTVVLWQTEGGQPRDDLAHVLRRWQEAGIPIYLKYGMAEQPPASVTINRPSRFMSIFHRLFVLAGLRRNSAGGFGSIVPEPSQSGGYG